MLRILILYGTILVVSSRSSDIELEETFSWKIPDFEWPTDFYKREAEKHGSYIFENNNMHGISIWKNKMFVTIPRYRPGVASSLNYFEIGTEKSPKLNPYPSWDANFIQEEKENSLKDNSSVVSAFRSWVDECDRLWVMDTGMGNITGIRKSIAKPAIVIYDLKTDTLLRRYNLKDSEVEKSSYLLNIIVDADSEKCDEAFAYVADMGSSALIVYSFEKNDSWRLKHHYFHFSPLEGHYVVGGVEFQWDDGVFGLALSERDDNGLRKIYFHPLSSIKEFYVYNNVLQNETWATNHESFNDYKLVGDRGPSSHSSMSVYYEDVGIIFYTQVRRDGVACWNTNKPMNEDNVPLIMGDMEKMEFPNDLRIVDDDLWIISNKLPKFIYKSLDPDEINYRVFKVPIFDAIKGSKCDK